MKKTLMLLVVLVLFGMNVVEAKPIRGVKIKVNYGWPNKEGICNPNDFGICSIVISWRTALGLTDSNAEIIEATGEIVNNQLVLILPKGINEKGRNARGEYSFSIPSEMTLEPEIAKELGVEKLVIAPGKYDIKGNKLALKIVSPRDAASGLPTGKRQHSPVK